MSKTKTTGEAMDVLEQHRAELIANARKIADGFISQRGKTNTKEVREAMEELRLIHEGVRDHWLGAVFNNKRYRWTGEWALGFSTKDAHAPRPVKVWTHADGVAGAIFTAPAGGSAYAVSSWHSPE